MRTMADLGRVDGQGTIRVKLTNLKASLWVLSMR